MTGGYITDYIGLPENLIKSKKICVCSTSVSVSIHNINSILSETLKGDNYKILDKKEEEYNNTTRYYFYLGKDENINFDSFNIIIYINNLGDAIGFTKFYSNQSLVNNDDNNSRLNIKIILDLTLKTGSITEADKSDLELNILLEEVKGSNVLGENLYSFSEPSELKKKLENNTTKYVRYTEKVSELKSASKYGILTSNRYIDNIDNGYKSIPSCNSDIKTLVHLGAYNMYNFSYYNSDIIVSKFIKNRLEFRNHSFLNKDEVFGNPIIYDEIKIETPNDGLTYTVDYITRRYIIYNVDGSDDFNQSIYSIEDKKYINVYNIYNVFADPIDQKGNIVYINKNKRIPESFDFERKNDFYQIYGLKELILKFDYSNDNLLDISDFYYIYRKIGSWFILKIKDKYVESVDNETVFTYIILNEFGSLKTYDYKSWIFYSNRCLIKQRLNTENKYITYILSFDGGSATEYLDENNENIISRNSTDLGVHITELENEGNNDCIIMDSFRNNPLSSYDIPIFLGGFPGYLFYEEGEIIKLL